MRVLMCLYVRLFVVVRVAGRFVWRHLYMWIVIEGVKVGCGNRMYTLKCSTQLLNVVGAEQDLLLAILLYFVQFLFGWETVQ